MINSTYSLYPFDACLSVFEDFTPSSRPDEELYWDGHCEGPAGNPDALKTSKTRVRLEFN